MDDIKSICSRINLMRKQQGWTQDQMAAALELSQPAISKYLKDRVPPAETLLKLAHLGNTTIEWILTGEKNYYYGQKMQVNEPEYTYDSDVLLAKKIAGLPTEIRKVIIELIDAVQTQGK